MTPEQFKGWREHMRLKRSGAAMALYVGKNRPKMWEDGTVPIPPEIDLLCAALALKVRPWSKWPEEEVKAIAAADGGPTIFTSREADEAIKTLLKRLSK